MAAYGLGHELLVRIAYAQNPHLKLMLTYPVGIED